MRPNQSQGCDPAFSAATLFLERVTPKLSKLCIIGVLLHQCTVILIELPCIFFLLEILDIQGFSAPSGITEPVLESFPGRAFSVYSVFYGGSRCNFDCGTIGNNAPVVTLTEQPGIFYSRCNFIFPVDTLECRQMFFAFLSVGVQMHTRKHCQPML